jgi:hypothetical protein
MWSNSAPPITATDCGSGKTQACWSGLGWNGASAICGVRACAATSATASEEGTADDPMITSALSLSISRRAFLAACDGSVASSRMTYLAASPPRVGGSNSRLCFSGMPSEAAGPVVLSETPTTMVGAWPQAGACDRPLARARAMRVRRCMRLSPLRTWWGIRVVPASAGRAGAHRCTVQRVG